MVRLAVIGTPRSGNSWIRGVLREAVGLAEYAVHNYRDLPADLAEDCVLQIHWPREPGFQNFLQENRFRVVVPVRHPIDVLVSVLHFVRREPMTARWLEGNADIPPDFSAETPSSPGFERYALSYGAETLLSISYQWSFDAGADVLRYEKLVANPRLEFQSFLDRIGSPSERLGAALEANQFSVFRGTPNKHGWQGTPGLWQHLVPWSIAHQIRLRHRSVFDRLGYRVPAYVLTRRRAAKTWRQLAI